MNTKNEKQKILVVDDTLDNINAAKEYFSTTGLHVDYATSERSARELIRSEYLAGNGFDIVITDLEMEDKISGCHVLRDAYNYGADAIIATGRRYDSTLEEGNNHGAATGFHSINSKKVGGFGGIFARKSNPTVWGAIYDAALQVREKDENGLRKKLDENARFNEEGIGGIIGLVELLIYDRAYHLGWTENKIPFPDWRVK